MRDVVYLDQIEQAEALLKPQRIEVLRRAASPRSTRTTRTTATGSPSGRRCRSVRRCLPARSADVEGVLVDEAVAEVLRVLAGGDQSSALRPARLLGGERTERGERRSRPQEVRGDVVGYP